MGLVADIENRLLGLLKNLLEPVISPLTKLWNILKGFATALIDVVPETVSLVQLIISEVKAWRNFREGINPKTGVINLQSAQDRLQQIFDEIVASWQAVLHLFTDGFKLPFKSIEEAQQAAEEVVGAFEDFAGNFGLKELVSKLGAKLAKAGGKFLEFLQLLEAVAEEALKVVHEINTIVMALKDIRETLQTGEGLFLSQKNKRKVLTLQDGTKIKIRLGALHQ